MSTSDVKRESCKLCGRRVADLRRHHLVPRTRQNSRRSRKAPDRHELRERIAWLCEPCHKQVHALFAEKELERSFDTLAKLAAHPEIERFVRWLRTKPDGTQVVALPARRRGQGRKDPR